MKERLREKRLSRTRAREHEPWLPDALGDVNRARAERGEPPLTDEPGFNGDGNPHPSSCPVTGCDCDATSQAEHEQTIEQDLIAEFGGHLVDEGTP